MWCPVPRSCAERSALVRDLRTRLSIFTASLRRVDDHIQTAKSQSGARVGQPFRNTLSAQRLELAGTRGEHTATFSDPENVGRDYRFSYHPARRLWHF